MCCAQVANVTRWRYDGGGLADTGGWLAPLTEGLALGPRGGSVLSLLASAVSGATGAPAPSPPLAAATATVSSTVPGAAAAPVGLQAGSTADAGDAGGGTGGGGGGAGMQALHDAGSDQADAGTALSGGSGDTGPSAAHPGAAAALRPGAAAMGRQPGVAGLGQGTQQQPPPQQQLETAAGALQGQAQAPGGRSLHPGYYIAVCHLTREVVWAVRGEGSEEGRLGLSGLGLGSESLRRADWRGAGWLVVCRCSPLHPASWI